jgi:hypothetical protein
MTNRTTAPALASIQTYPDVTNPVIPTAYWR